MRIKYNISLIQTMSLFEQMTHAKVKDCFVDEKFNSLTFVVQPGEMGKALGKRAENVKKLEAKLQKKIRVVEFSPEKLDFIQNMIMPLKAENISEAEEGIVTISSNDTKTKGLLIGRNAQNLRNLEANVRRYFEVKEIRVV